MKIAMVYISTTGEEMRSDTIELPVGHASDKELATAVRERYQQTPSGFFPGGKKTNIRKIEIFSHALTIKAE